MKTTTPFVIFVLISFYSFSQRMNPKNMSFVPMGSLVVKNDTTTRTVSIAAFWMSEEVTNKEYRAFINSLKDNPNDSIGIMDLKKFKETKNKKDALNFYSYREILENVLDVSVWDTDNYFKNYFTDKKFDDYPVVGISYMNAVAYCCWKTKTENEINKKKGIPYVAENRLPTEAEWEYAATNSTHVNTKIITKVKSGKRNAYGLYNMNDNVAEWTLLTTETGEKVIRGSSWKTERKVSERFFVKPEFRDNATGFRMVKSYTGEK